MRVLLVSDGYPPVSGGLEAHVKRLAKYLNGVGHELVVVTAAGGGAGDSPWKVVVSSTWLAHVPGIHHQTMRRLPPPWPDPGMVRVIDDVAKRLNPDVIHAHGWCSSSARVVASRRDVPLVVTLHDYGMLCPMRTLLNGGQMCSHTAGLRCVRCPGSDQSAPKRLTLAAGIAITRKYRPVKSKYLAVSNAVAEVHRQAGVTDLIEVVPNFIDMPDSPFVPAPKHGPILYVGPSTEVKGLDVLVSAHRILVDRGKRTILHHVGGASISQDGYIVRSGRLCGDDLEAAYSSARVVVIPSKWEEPCPTVALEAMGVGRAIIASAVGGLIDIVDNGATGELVRPNDPQALAAALEALLDDNQRVESMGRAGRIRLEQFSTTTIGPRIEAAYVTTRSSYRNTI